MEIPEITANYKHIDDILYTGYGSVILDGAMEIGFFDALAAGPAGADVIADRLGTVESLTEALADALTALGLLRKGAAVYSLTDESREFLVASSRTYQRGAVKSNFAFGRYMTDMPKLIRAGEPGRDNAFYYSIDMMRSMAQGTLSGSLQDAVDFITALPEFLALKHVCDLAGNHGFYTMALLDQNPVLRGTICDQPDVAELAQDFIKEMGYEGRMDTIGIDLETEGSFGGGYDLVFTSHMLYSWKGRLEEIFTRINQSLVPGGVFVSNHCTVIEGEELSVPSAMMELMTRLAGYPSHHFTEGELKDALSACGFSDFTVIYPEETRRGHNLLLAARKKK